LIAFSDSNEKHEQPAVGGLKKKEGGGGGGYKIDLQR